MMFGGWDYEPGDTFLAEESFDDYYGDEIEDRVAPEPDDTPSLPPPFSSDLPWSTETYQQQQLELGAAY